MNPAKKTLGLLLCLTVAAACGSSGCELLAELALPPSSDAPSGAQSPGGVRLQIENQAGVAVSVAEAYFNNGELVRQTSRLLAASGPESTKESLWTDAARVTLLAVVAAEESPSPSALLLPGEELANKEFIRGVDFFPGDTLTVVITPGDVVVEITIDCNENGTLDALDITSETSADCNLNEIPDECDIAAGTSEDCNANGIPDACEPDLDCNGNGVQDICDIAAGTSEDCDGNGILDECQLRAVAVDACGDAQSVCPGIVYEGTTVGATRDGNTNCDESEGDSAADVWYKYTPATDGLLTASLCGSEYDTMLSIHSGCPGTVENELVCDDDTCSLHSQVALPVLAGTTYLIRVSGFESHEGLFVLELTGPDCQEGGRDSDCNENGTPDPCDIADGTSLDANTNGVPDECEFAEPFQITFDAGPETQPVWNPAGEEIAFITTRSATGSARNIGAVRSDGTGEVVIVDGPDGGFGVGNSPSWVGSTGLLAMNERVFFHEYMAFDTTGHLPPHPGGSTFVRVVQDDDDAAFTRKLMIDGGGGGDMIRVSRDGSTALWRFSSSGGSGLTSIMTAPYDSLARENASTGPIGTVLNIQENAVPPAVLYSFGAGLTPDGSKFVIPKISGAGFDLFVYNTDGTGTPIAITTSGASSEMTNREPEISPDGTTVAFASNASGVWDIWVVGIGGTGLSQVTSDPKTQSHPTWSPTGDRIAFAQSDGSWNLYVVPFPVP